MTWFLGNRLLLSSALWVWGKTGLVVWSGAPMASPPHGQVVHVAMRATSSKKSQPSSRRLPQIWWRSQGGGDVSIRDARSLERDTELPAPVGAHKQPTARQRSHRELLSRKRAVRRSGPLVLSRPIPRASIVSKYGWRISPISGKMSFHRGRDYGASFGTPVRAAAAGIVHRIGWMGSCGMGVVLRHRAGVRTVYCHLSQILASHGSQVARGAVIGRVGSTGNSTSPHLHFGVLYRGHFVNPGRFLRKKR